MALSAIPTAITAGAALSVQLSFTDFPASQGWSLRWVIQGPAAIRVIVNSTPSTDAHLITLQGADSEKLLGGCSWQLWAIQNTEKRVAGAGVMRVSIGLETVTSEEKTLVSLKAALERLVQDDEAEVWIHDRKIVFKDPKKVQDLIEIYEGKVRIQRGGRPIVMVPVVLR